MVTDSQSPRRRGARIELLERIGSGGMADIHRARLVGLDGFERVVAVKLMRSELAGVDKHIARFVEEARVGALLDHPNIASVFDFVELDGRRAIVLELVRGADLLRLLEICTRTRRRVPVELAVQIAIEAARGLAHAHTLTRPDRPYQTGLVHGDVSPANVMVSYAGQVKLIDFGVSGVEDTSAGPRALRGKLGYLSPEMVRGQPLDPRSDLFALGTVLWEMLTLRRLFKSDDDRQTLRNIAEVRVAERFARHDYVPAALLAIITRTLARSPADRHASGSELAADLVAWLVSAGHFPTADALGRLVRELAPEEPLGPPLPLATRTQAAPDAPLDASMSGLDLSGLDTVLAELDQSAADLGAFHALVAGTWQDPALALAPHEPEAELEFLPSSVSLGRLDPFTFPALLARLAARKTTGALTLEDGARVKTIYLAEGGLAHVDSNITSELLGNRMASAGLLTPAEARRGLEHSRARSKRLGSALVELQTVSAEHLELALIEQLERRFTDAFAWSEGELHLELGRTPANDLVQRGLDLAPLIAKGLREQEHWARARVGTLFEQHRDRVIRWRPERAFGPGSLGLLAEERDALAWFTPGAPVARILGQGADAPIRTLLLLVQTEQIHLVPASGDWRGV